MSIDWYGVWADIRAQWNAWLWRVAFGTAKESLHRQITAAGSYTWPGSFPAAKRDLTL